MWDANAVIDEYCDPFPNRPRPGRAEFLAALDLIAQRERQDPNREFRIEDSSEPTTAGKLLDTQEMAYSDLPRCTHLGDEISRARHRR
jgi:hypothetical protein